MNVTDVFSYNVSISALCVVRVCMCPDVHNINSACGLLYFCIIYDVLDLSLQTTGVNCSVLNDLAQLKGRQRDVRPLHPEDMLQNDFLVRPNMV